MRQDKTKVLIHTCCAPDAAYSVPLLRQDHEIAGYFYNPNIYPRREYDKRLNDVKALAKLQHYRLWEGEYEPEQWHDAVKGFEHLGEYSERCRRCITNSLYKTALKAKSEDFDMFATTLTNSPRKKIQMLDEIGAQIEEKTKIAYLRTNFKKKDGYLMSVRLSKALNIYRQDYCGCEYSLKEKENFQEEKVKNG